MVKTKREKSRQTDEELNAELADITAAPLKAAAAADAATAAAAARTTAGRLASPSYRQGQNSSG